MNNLALGRPARQTTGANADNAVDGDRNGHYMKGQSCTHTINTDNPWWVVDLGSNFTIETVIIYNRVDCKFSAKSYDSICTKPL